VRSKIANLAIGNLFNILRIRSGEQGGEIFTDGFIAIRNDNCIVASGVQYLEN